MYDDLRDRCKNEDWFRSQDRITTKRKKYTVDLEQKGINSFDKNMLFKITGFCLKFIIIWITSNKPIVIWEYCKHAYE